MKCVLSTLTHTIMKYVPSFALCFCLNLCLAYGQAPAATQTPAAGQQQPTPTPEQTPATPVTAAGNTTVLSVLAPPEKSQPVRVARFESAPVIDGILDEEVWKNAAPMKDFYQVSPGDNIAPSQRTEVRIGYDDKFLYLAFQAFDEAGKVRATVAKRDQVFDDDNVTVYLDTFNDQRKAYLFTFNPHGIQADAVFTEGGGEDYSVDVVMTSKGAINPDGYTVEVSIPFKSLRYEAGKGKFWGIHLFRRIKRLNNEENSWLPISRDKSGVLNQAGRITGLEGISTERTLELIPSLTISEGGRRVSTLTRQFLQANPNAVDPGRFVNEPIGAEPGLTAKLGITPTVTLDLAINPDFAQVEADETVVLANQRFPIFFAEKRPFFLEGIEIFQTPLNAVDTRAVVDPDMAVKLTGKRGRNTFGLLFASDNAPGNFSDDERTDPDTLPGIERFLDKNAYIGVLRLQRDIGKESRIGVIGTTYNFLERKNHLGGIDGRLQVNQQTYFAFQAAATNSQVSFFDGDPRAGVCGSGNGFGYSFNYDSSGRHFGYRFSGRGRTRNYCALVGFTPRTNTNQEELFLRYNSEPNPKAKLISWSIYNSFRPGFDWQGRSQNWTNETQVSFNLVRQTSIGIGASGGYERLFEEEFGPAGTFAGGDSERSTYKKVFYAFGSTNPTKKYSLFFLGIYNAGAFDFDFGAGQKFPRVSPRALIDPGAALDPGAGTSLDLQGSFAFQPTDAFRVSLDYTKSRLSRRDTGRVAFDDNIYSVRATYQFSRFTFARARVDYDSLFANVRGQYLLGYTPNPGTAFYVGYNNDLNYNGFNPFTGQGEPGFRRNGQTFFIKATYLFRRSF